MPFPLSPKLKEVKTDHEVLQQLMAPLCYFAIFSYPLQAQEIQQLSKVPKLSLQQVEESLAQAVRLGLIYEQEGFYLTENDPNWLAKRKDNNHRATRYLNRAYHVTRLIRRFPFVRGVFLSGALSKNVMPKDGDLDYFIVTKPGRLWVSRTFLVLFKKLFLFNSHKYFCVNYFVDEDNLEIEAKNQFTATEIVTLVPLHNPRLYHAFRAANDWTDNYFPNFPLRDTQKTLAEHPSKIQRLSERILAGKWGEKLDHYFMEKTLRFWQRKFTNFDPAKFTNALKSRRDVSKHHPQDFQTKVLTAFEENCRKLKRS